MKYIKSILSGVAVAVTLLACQPEDFPSIGERRQVVPELSGTWKLSKVLQRDNDAERKGFPEFAKSQDITNDFPYSDFRITLNTTAAGAPSTFTITTGGSPNIIGNVTEGNWSVDDQDFPSKITFAGEEGPSIELGSFTGLSNGEMVFKLIRYQPRGASLQSVVTYQYTFTKQN